MAEELLRFESRAVDRSHSEGDYGLVVRDDGTFLHHRGAAPLAEIPQVRFGTAALERLRAAIAQAGLSAQAGARSEGDSNPITQTFTTGDGTTATYGRELPPGAARLRALLDDLVAEARDA